MNFHFSRLALHALFMLHGAVETYFTECVNFYYRWVRKFDHHSTYYLLLNRILRLYVLKNCPPNVKYQLASLTAAWAIIIE